MFSSFGWFVVNVFVTLFWLAVALVSGNYFVGLGAIIYIAMLALIDLPASSSSEDEGGGGDEDGNGVL